ncbi:T9SS type A sorting domain-containing protein [Hymenobacter busanensis]|uniref:T9SS type A sorting domain-containing protein n=1 Tax=Hymenobacter busanensis TaxID=2607656 RepID=A0A7L4ZZH9_9BACT|nr:zinc-dependent metalloprotease family protein [Hymenobacter busanensis]KAA9331527.1 T9SS type A sorting domain-containing protein [Hymenobacter busanensis]QHJ08681.1 T9SS type A sorting domain-containing protein [Hymenobacter busanensis]
MPHFYSSLSAVLLCSALGTTQATAQQRAPATPWHDEAAARTLMQAGPSGNWTTHSRALSLDVTAMKAVLAATPLENLAARGTQAGTVLTLPLPDGSNGRFRIVEAPIMEPALAARYPGIHTYTGVGLDDPYATLRCDLTPQGFHAQVLSPVTGSIYIDPVSLTDTGHYISYFKRDLRRGGQASMGCGFVPTPEEAGKVLPSLAEEAAGNVRRSAVGSGTQLRTYRLAMAATGEYTQVKGGTVAAALAAITTSVNRVVGVYEKELAVRLVLVGSTDQVIYTDPATDPYSNLSNSATLSTNQTTLDNRIGSASYDIGHVFNTADGGIAGLGVVCSSTRKGQGSTGLPNPTGDAFDIDYVAHEMGHQFGGNHTFNNNSVGSCTGNRNGSTAFEPGSGSTIQAYAGICGTVNNLQAHSDPFFHSGSFEEMRTFIAGTSCGTTTATSNTAPVVTAPASGKTLPISTPFKLTASATDAEGDALNYNWEEMDLGPAANTNDAQVANSTVPLFRSFNATTSPTRYFPQLSDILAGTSVVGERLPTVTRTLKFRCTARDQHNSGGALGVIGGVDFSSFVNLNVTSAAGPFVINSPNTAVSWAGSSVQTVTWNVAGTSAAPVSCAQVNIRLSTDGGLTYPFLLAANEANDGSASVTLPNVVTSTARVMVEAADNYFFDLSDVNFAITPAATGLSVSSFTPTSGPVGTSVTVNGNEFTTGAGTLGVTFNGVAGTPTNITNTSFTVLVPTGATTGNLTVTKGAASATGGVFTVTVVATAGSNGPLCAGSSLNLTASGGTSYSWTGPNGFTSTLQNPSISNVTTAASGTYTVTVTSGTISAQATTSVTVNAAPGVPTIGPTTPSTCSGTPVTLTANAPTNGSINTTLIDENFNGTATGWTPTYSTTGNAANAANTAWQLYGPSDILLNSADYSLDGTQYMAAASAFGGNATNTRTQLTSPVFSAAGYSSLTLSFQHGYFYTNTVDAAAIVEISTNGGNSWAATLVDYKAIGSDQSGSVSLNLNAYAGQSNLRLRWRYETNGKTLLWAIDNVKVIGSVPAPNTYAWTLVSGNGLPATTNTASLTVSPTTTSVYQVTVTNSTGCPGVGQVTVNVTAGSTWTGNTSTSWTAPGNWSGCGVPTATTDVQIPAGRTNYPSLLAGTTAQARSLTIENGGQLTMNATATLQVSGNFINQNAAAYSAAGTLQFLGTNPELTGLASANNLVMDLATGSTNLANDLSVTGGLTMTNGLLNTGSHTLTLGSAATLTESETSYVVGKVQTTRPLSPGTAQTFGGLGLTLAPVAGSTSPGSTLVIRTTGTALNGTNNSQSVKRYFDIRPATSTGLNVNMAFRYFAAELNGISESNLMLFRSTSGVAGPWQPQGYSTRDAATNTLTKTGVTAFSIWTLGSSVLPLPVELSAFTAERRNSAVQLKWTTAQEKNNDHFDVERSLDGKSFAALGQVAGSGSSSTPREYAWTDSHLPTASVLYYRLRQVDFDGKSTVSEVRTVVLAESADLLVASAMPNPFDSRLGLAVTAPVAAPAKLALTDALGRPVLHHSATLPAGYSEVELPGVARLAPGVYFLRLQQGRMQRVVKVVKN